MFIGCDLFWLLRLRKSIGVSVPWGGQKTLYSHSNCPIFKFKPDWWQSLPSIVLLTFTFRSTSNRTFLYAGKRGFQAARGINRLRTSLSGYRPSVAAQERFSAGLPRSSRQARAGSNRMAPSMLTRNMKVSRIPMSAWNLSGEKIQVATPIASVTPVKTTPLPVMARVCR